MSKVFSLSWLFKDHIKDAVIEIPKDNYKKLIFEMNIFIIPIDYDEGML
jgi:hypothetical protein